MARQRSSVDKTKLVQVLVAIYAAAVGTAAFGWQVFEHIAQRPILRAECFSPIVVVSSHRERPQVKYRIRLSNVGSKPATVYGLSAWVMYSDVFPRGLDETIKRSDQNPPLPLKLDVGDLRTFLFTSSVTSFEGFREGQHRGQCVITLKSTVGTQEFNEPIDVLSAILQPSEK